MSNYYGDFDREIKEQKNTDIVCSQCGCDTIERQAWLTINTKEFREWCDEEDGDIYCPACKDIVDILTREEWEKMEGADIKVGDKVMISTESEFYDDGEETNPKGEVGYVLSVDDDARLPYIVRWTAGTNSYGKNDLEKFKYAKTRR